LVVEARAGGRTVLELERSVQCWGTSQFCDTLPILEYQMREIQGYHPRGKIISMGRF